MLVAAYALFHDKRLLFLRQRLKLNISFVKIMPQAGDQRVVQHFQNGAQGGVLKRFHRCAVFDREVQFWAQLD